MSISIGDKNGSSFYIGSDKVREIYVGSDLVYRSKFLLFKDGQFYNGLTNTFKYGNKHSIQGNYLRLSTNEGSQKETNTVNIRSLTDLSNYTKLVFVKYDGGYCRVGLSNYVGPYGSDFLIGVDSVVGDNVIDISGLNPNGTYYLNFGMNNSTARFSEIYLE